MMEPTAFSSEKLGAAHLYAFILDAKALGAYALEYNSSSAKYHMAGSWHGRKDPYGKHMLAADVNALDGNEHAEQTFFRDKLLPHAKAHGLAVTCGLGKYRVPAHSIGDGLHFHVDIGRWSNLGEIPGSTGYRVPWVGKPTTEPWAVLAFQKQVGGLAVDGINGKETTKALQKKMGVTADGIIGPETAKAIQKKVGTYVDGILGPDTYYALSAWVEAGCK